MKYFKVKGNEKRNSWFIYKVLDDLTCEYIVIGKSSEWKRSWHLWTHERVYD